MKSREKLRRLVFPCSENYILSSQGICVVPELLRCVSPLYTSRKPSSYAALCPFFLCHSIPVHVSVGTTEVTYLVPPLSWWSPLSRILVLHLCLSKAEHSLAVTLCAKKRQEILDRGLGNSALVVLDVYHEPPKIVWGSVCIHYKSLSLVRVSIVYIRFGNVFMILQM